MGRVCYGPSCPGTERYNKLPQFISMSNGYSDKTDHGQNGPDKTDHVSEQNGPRSRTKRTKLQDKTDHVSGQNGSCFRTNRTMQEDPVCFTKV